MSYKQKVYVLQWHSENDGDYDWGIGGVFSSKERAKSVMLNHQDNAICELAERYDIDCSDVSSGTGETWANASYDCDYYNWSITEMDIDYRG